MKSSLCVCVSDVLLRIASRQLPGHETAVWETEWPQGLNTDMLLVPYTQ